MLRQVWFLASPLFLARACFGCQRFCCCSSPVKPAPAAVATPVYDPKAIVPAVEFGGPWGVFGIIAYSHFIVLYLYYVLNATPTSDGSLYFPKSLEEAFYLFPTMFRKALSHGSIPYASFVYTCFLVMQAVSVVAHACA
jgi:hypothetical protein